MIAISNIEEILKPINDDYIWRKDEIDNLQNIQNLIDDKHLKSIFRKTQILVLYAHYEGFFRFAFTEYANYINSIDVKLHEALDIFLVSSLYKTFEDYDDKNNWLIKSKEGDDDKFLDKIKNRVLFVDKLKKGIEDDIVSLPVGDFREKKGLTHTKSNLDTETAQNILYRLGLDVNLGFYNKDFMEMMGKISQLIKDRHKIAHGDPSMKDGISADVYIKYEELLLSILLKIKDVVSLAIKQKAYLKEEFRVNSNNPK